MKVLHIANWYPNRWENKEALFVREHFTALEKHCHNFLIHLEVRYSPDTYCKFVTYRISPKEEAYVIQTNIKVWRVIEVLYLKLLLFVLFKYRVNAKFDIINFHIAYPLLTYRNILKRVIKLPIVVTEHWTAYHFNFNLPLDTVKLERIKKIFSSDLPVIAVSRSLCSDIKKFSNNFSLPCTVVPNVVNENLFKYQEKDKSQISFFMVNYWRTIKKPFVLLEAFKELVQRLPNAKLRVGGYGPLWKEMIAYVKEQGMLDSVEFLGKLNKEQVAREMQKCTMFIHAADYETFSVVCAEALMCGTPVIMTNLPAVAEFINSSNGRLVDEKQSWSEVMIQEIKEQNRFDHESIAEKAKEMFSASSVGLKYYNHLRSLVDEA